MPPEAAEQHDTLPCPSYEAPGSMVRNKKDNEILELQAKLRLETRKLKVRGLINLVGDKEFIEAKGVLIQAMGRADAERYLDELFGQEAEEGEVDLFFNF